MSNRLWENYCGSVEIKRSAHLGQQENTTQDAQTGCPARPQRVKAREAYPLGYVEGLNDARTMLADFFSILLKGTT
jgi:hypothetical protein